MKKLEGIRAGKGSGDEGGRGGGSQIAGDIKRERNGDGG